MAIAKAGFQYEILLVTRLDREAKEPSGSQRPSNPLEHLRQVSDVAKHVGGGRQIEVPGLRPQKLGQLAAEQVVIDLAALRELEHVRRDIDPGQRAGARTNACSKKARTATEVQDVQSG